MKEQIIKIIESKAQGKYHLEIDESDLEVIANEILNLFSVSKCQHPYKKVISGDDGMWCTECNKYITTF